MVLQEEINLNNDLWEVRQIKYCHELFTSGVFSMEELNFYK